MRLTLDQLCYVLERKYNGIRIGIDVHVTETTTPDITHPTGMRSDENATILSWNISQIPEPSIDQIQKMWSVLEEQYHSDPTRRDSKMYFYVNYKDWDANNFITVNEEI
jgi:hypothetical protein